MDNFKNFEITKQKQKVIKTNARAINLLYHAVCGVEYNKLSTYEMTKETWDKLEVLMKVQPK